MCCSRLKPIITDRIYCKTCNKSVTRLLVTARCYVQINAKLLYKTLIELSDQRSIKEISEDLISFRSFVIVVKALSDLTVLFEEL